MRRPRYPGTVALLSRILNANPYAFLDDAPLEERRARAVMVRRTLSRDWAMNSAGSTRLPSAKYAKKPGPAWQAQGALTSCTTRFSQWGGCRS